jgi:hypothetical protein
MTDDVPQIPRVNWRRVTEGASTKEYQSAIDGMLRPLIGNSYDSITQVEQELKLVTTGVCKFAIESLPVCKGRNTSKRIFKDDELKRLCGESKQTWSEWVDAGRPITGDLYERKKKQEGCTASHQ